MGKIIAGLSSGSSLDTPVSITDGGTGATTAAAARAALRVYPARRLVNTYWETIAGLTATTNSALQANQILAAPIDITESCTVDRLRWRITTGPVATALLRLGLYSADGAGAISTLLVDGGEISIASGYTGTVESTVSVALVSGRYWFAGLSDTSLTGATIGTGQWLDMPFLDAPGDLSAQPFGYKLAQAYGALPASLATAARTSAGSANRPYIGAVRISGVV